MRYTLVATAKNEGPYILEWVAFHKLIGFDNILIFQNDSDDGTGRTLRILDEIGVVTYRYNPARAGMHQLRAYRRAAATKTFRRADWAIALDLDEFLHIHTGDGSLRALSAALPQADEVLVNWRRFGWNDQAKITDALVTQRFTATERPEIIQENFVAYKALFRPSCFDRAGIHRPNGPLIPEGDLRVCNGSGLLQDAFRRRNYRSTDPGGRGLAQINHYMIRDAASFVLKSARGSAHQAARDIDRRYWRNRNFNAVQERSLASRADEIAAVMAELDARSSGRLQRLRRHAIQAHQSRFEELMGDAQYRALYDHCLGSEQAQTQERAA